MRVNSSNIYGPSTTGAQGTGRVDGKYGSQRAGGFDGGSLDNADISAKASLLSRVLSASSTERSSRVAELANQVQSGAYVDDPLKMSKWMVSEMLQNRPAR